VKETNQKDMKEKDTKLDPDIARLLAAERENAATVPADVRARVLARARASVSEPLARQARRPRPVLWIRFAAAAGLLLAAAGAIAGLHARWSAPAPAVSEPVVTTPARRAVVAPATAPAAEPAPLPSIAPQGRPRAPARDQGAEAELRLVRQAQEAVAQGRFDAAVAPIAEHIRRFPNGRLVEEREALRIQALAKLGRVADARRAATAFRARFPRSVLLPRISDIPGASP
jgi:hypothetical protein